MIMDDRSDPGFCGGVMAAMAPAILVVSVLIVRLRNSRGLLSPGYASGVCSAPAATQFKTASG